MNKPWIDSKDHSMNKVVQFKYILFMLGVNDAA